MAKNFVQDEKVECLPIIAEETFLPKMIAE